MPATTSVKNFLIGFFAIFGLLVVAAVFLKMVGAI